jgi:hypothetical protein
MSPNSFDYSTEKVVKLIFKVRTFPHKKFSKINFTAFPMELRNKILKMDVVFGKLSFGHIIELSRP